MSAEGTCSECGDQLYWYPAINEEGWRCCSCGHKPGEPAGYCPHLDKDLIAVKVDGLVHDAHDAKLISVSNGSAGDGLTALVMAKCIELGRYDQTTILRLIFEADESHAVYWAKIGDGVRAGEDPRERCAGGRLATCFAGTWNGWHSTCSEPGCSCRAGKDEVPF